jgi:hypothetical protein
VLVMVCAFGLGFRCVAICSGQPRVESVLSICQKGSCCHFGCVVSVISLCLKEFYRLLGCSVYVWPDCLNIMNLVIISPNVFLLDAMYTTSFYPLCFVLS